MAGQKFEVSKDWRVARERYYELSDQVRARKAALLTEWLKGGGVKSIQLEHNKLSRETKTISIAFSNGRKLTLEQGLSLFTIDDDMSEVDPKLALLEAELKAINRIYHLEA